MLIGWRGFVQRVQKHQAVTFNHGHWQREKKLGRWCVCSFHHVCDEQALLPLPSYDFATRGRHSTLENVLHQFIQISLLRESRARSDNCSVKLVVWCWMVGHVSAVVFGLQNFVFFYVGCLLYEACKVVDSLNHFKIILYQIIHICIASVIKRIIFRSAEGG